MGDYLDANRGTLDREASDTGNFINGELDSGKAAADSVASHASPGVGGVVGGPQAAPADYSNLPGYADADQKQIQGQQDAALTKDQGGLQQILDREYGKRPGNAFDAQLLGSRDFSGVRNRAESLHDYLDSATKAASTPLQQVPQDSRPGRAPFEGAPPQSPAPNPGGPLSNPPGTPPWGGPPQGQNPWRTSLFSGGF